jgi:hypothetical protein
MTIHITILFSYLQITFMTTAGNISTVVEQKVVRTYLKSKVD